MNQNLDSVQAQELGTILCYYFNVSKQIQIATIKNSGYSFERVVFPGERLLFEAPPEAELEIQTSQRDGTKAVDKIKCNHLRVDEGDYGISNSHESESLIELTDLSSKSLWRTGDR
ncbi:MAG: DUF1830 domain-containing protein [Coleofasciculus sp. S288]|nr:DUF1830 domain-containing protein [Coleofasciculus sp. S288]